MTSSVPPAAVPGPDGKPDWEQPDAPQQPDPFGEAADVEGATDAADGAEEEERPKDDPRGQ